MHKTSFSKVYKEVFLLKRSGSSFCFLVSYQANCKVISADCLPWFLFKIYIISFSEDHGTNKVLDILNVKDDRLFTFCLYNF